MFKVYSSSAGSGKTYTLTKEYLKLALQSDSDTYFRSILAVTFTNAAANEMKDRILSMLRTFSTPEGFSHPMLKDIITEIYPGIEGDQKLYTDTLTIYSLRAQKVFRKILHRYSDFSVMTIDKFTQRLVSSFTDELGIPFGFDTQVDADQLANAVDRMLARIGQEGEKVLTDVVETYYRESAESGKSWGALPDRIREAAYDLLNESSHLAMQKVKDLEVEDWVGISRQIKVYLKGVDKPIVEIAKKATALIEGNNLAAADFTQGAKGIFGYFDKRAEGVDCWTAPNSYVLGAVNEGKWYTAKAPNPIKNTIDGISDELIGYQHAIQQVVDEEGPKMSLLKLIDKHLYNLSLLGEIRKEFNALLRQKNQVHISEFNRKILEIVAKEPVPFIFERLGDKYNHILVDEFQDTSKLQFANLLPLIDNALGFGHFNLIVGDAKQSIYRFRGGDMDLILHLSKDQVGEIAQLLGDNIFTEERLLGVGSYLEVAHLQTNRRSYREVTEFNNSFFSTVAATVNNEMVSAVFDENFQQKVTEDVKTNGHVQIEFLTQPKAADSEDSEEDNPDSVMVSRTLELVDELREKGYQWRDIAILCRKKKEAVAIASSLKERGNPLISDDSLLLTYAQTVNLLVSFMQVLQTPDNALVRYQAAHLFHRVIQREIPNALQQEAISLMCAEKDVTTFLTYFESMDITLSAFRLRQLGVYELCEKLITTFDLYNGLKEAPYLFRFLDAVLEFGTRRSNHLADFLDYWVTAKDKISITVPSITDALRITTIHKSKGLEYPVVIVPNADWSFVPSGQRDRIWVDLEGVKANELIIERTIEEVGVVQRRLTSSVVSMVKELESTVLAEEYEEEKTRTLLENLNLLYVAFTRPIQRLYILAKNTDKWDKTPSSVNKWLHDYLNSPTSPVAWEDGKSLYVLHQGAGDCYHQHSKDNAVPYTLESIISNDRTDRLRLRRLAERIFDVETFEQKKDHIQKMKYAFSLIERKSDIPGVIKQLCTAGIIEPVEGKIIQRSIENLIAKDPIHSLFGATGKVRLKTEILLPHGKTALADRVVTLPDGSSVIVNVVAGEGNDSARRSLRKVLQAYETMNPTSKALLIILENEGVEWIE